MTKITKKECIKIIYLANKFALDIWVFNELFVKGTQDYTFYEENYKEISRIKLKKEEFVEIKTLLKKYSK